jgi:sugar phosphate isomerase/epimerase
MRYIFFSKMVREQPIPQLIETLKRIGADGVDLAVRPGYPVNPDNVRKALPEAAKRIKEAGLAIPMVSTATDLTDPSKPYVEELWAACHDAQIPHVKVGYWQHKGKDYWKIVDQARRDMEGFEKLAMRFGVKPCLHTHSGNYVGVNASSVMHIVKGFNPNAVGVYLDPGHLQVNGEPLSVAFDMVAEYLSLVAIKDSYCEKGKEGKARVSHFVPLGQGFVDWREMMRILVARNYDGSLSFHSEYEGLTPDALIEQTKKDMLFMRAVEREVKSA